MTPTKPSSPSGRIIREGESRPRPYVEDRPRSFEPEPFAPVWSCLFGFYAALCFVLWFEVYTGKAFIGGAIAPAACEALP